MKLSWFQWVRIGSFVIIFTAISCHPKEVDPTNLYSYTRGYFDWVSTTSPSGTITPKTVGYTKQLAQAIDSNPGGQSDINYVAFYKNDTLQKRYNESRVQLQPYGYGGNYKQGKIIIKYDTIGYLTYYTNPNTSMENYIQISEFHISADSGVDTIRSLYKQNSYLRKSLYPY